MYVNLFSLHHAHCTCNVQYTHIIQLYSYNALCICSRVQVQQEKVVVTNELNRKHSLNQRNESYIHAAVYLVWCICVYIALNCISIVLPVKYVQLIFKTVSKELCTLRCSFIFSGCILCYIGTVPVQE